MNQILQLFESVPIHPTLRYRYLWEKIFISKFLCTIVFSTLYNYIPPSVSRVWVQKSFKSKLFKSLINIYFKN